MMEEILDRPFHVCLPFRLAEEFDQRTMRQPAAQVRRRDGKKILIGEPNTRTSPSTLALAFARTHMLESSR